MNQIFQDMLYFCAKLFFFFDCFIEPVESLKANIFLDIGFATTVETL